MKTFKEYTFPYTPIDSYRPTVDLTAGTIEPYGSVSHGLDTFKPMVTGSKRKLITKWVRPYTRGPESIEAGVKNVNVRW